MTVVDGSMTVVDEPFFIYGAAGLIAFFETPNNITNAYAAVTLSGELVG